MIQTQKDKLAVYTLYYSAIQFNVQKEKDRSRWLYTRLLLLLFGFLLKIA